MRYLFTVFQEIETLDFQHFELVCDRLFVLVPPSVRQVPLTLVRRLQRLGKAVKWVDLPSGEAAQIGLQLAFLLGSLHEKMHPEIEFALLSDRAEFDPLVSAIFDKGRPCVRVRATAEQPAVSFKFSEKPLTETSPQRAENQAFVAQSNGKPKPSENGNGHREAATVVVPKPEESDVRETAVEVIERLVRSGNRPMQVSSLKQYINLLDHRTDASAVAERVMAYMALNNSIEIRDKEVVYNF